MNLKQETQKLKLDGALWQFALAFYGRPRIAEVCLRLQDEAGVDVVALIVVLYADAVLGRGWDDRDISEFLALMTCWREETVLPLRRLRRTLKQPPREFPSLETEALRRFVKKAELRAEQIQLAMAERWLAKRSLSSGMPLEEAVKFLSHAAAEHGDSKRLFEQAVAEARETARR